MSLSNSSLEREIDEYQDVSFGSEGSYKSSESSTASSESSDEHYSSGVPGIPLEEFEELQRRKASASDSHYSLIKGRSSSDKLWKTEFFIISGNWAGDPVDVHSAPFPPFTNPIGCLCPEGMFSFQFISFFSFFQLSIV